MKAITTNAELTPLERTREAMTTPAQRAITEVMPELAKLPQIECPLVHRFTENGLYTREIFMPKGTLIISKIHKTEHPYVIITGKVKVWIEGVGVQLLNAPHVGITRAGTRRILEIVEDCRWLTFHPTSKKTPEEAEEEIIYDQAKEDATAIPVEIIHELKEAK